MKKNLRIFSVLFVAAMTMVGCGEKENEETNTEKMVAINVLSNNDSWGTVSGSGSYAIGSTVTLSATANDGYSFLGWSDGNTDNPRTFTAEKNAVYEAIFGVTPQGDGSCVVNWDGKEWNAAAVYAVRIDEARNVVTLEIFQDPNDNTKPMVVCGFPMATGTYQATQGGDFFALYYDYPGQTGSYQGQQIPPYQAAQGLSMTIEAIDPVNGIVQGVIYGSFVNIEEYGANPNNPITYQLEVNFNASKWLSVADSKK